MKRRICFGAIVWFSAGDLRAQLLDLRRRQGLRNQRKVVCRNRPVGKVRSKEDPPLFKLGHEFIIDVFIADAMGKAVDSGSHEFLRVFEIEDVRNRAQIVLVRLIDDGPVDVGWQLLHSAIPVIHPELDDVDLLRRKFLNNFSRLRFGCHAVGRIFSIFRTRPHQRQRDTRPGRE